MNRVRFEVHHPFPDIGGVEPFRTAHIDLAEPTGFDLGRAFGPVEAVDDDGRRWRWARMILTEVREDRWGRRESGVGSGVPEPVSPPPAAVRTGPAAGRG